MYIILKYAKEKGLLPLKCGEMQNLQKEVINSFFTEEIEKGIQKIRSKYFSKEEWDKVLVSSRYFYFVPDNKMEICNKAIKMYIKEKIGFVPSQHIYSWSMFSGQLSKMFILGNNIKYGIKRFKVDGVYRYSI